MNKKIIIVAAAAVTIGGGAGAFFFAPDLLPGFIRPHDAQSSEAKKSPAAKKPEHEVEADLDVFVVNLSGDGPARYLRTTLSFGVTSEHEKEEVKKFNAVIRHAVIMYLTERTVEQLNTPEGKTRVRADLHKAINAAVGKKLVTNVYFKEFLIQ
jgi:flagellar FliL protein